MKSLSVAPDVPLIAIYNGEEALAADRMLKRSEKKPDALLRDVRLWDRTCLSASKFKRIKRATRSDRPRRDSLTSPRPSGLIISWDSAS